MKFYVAGRVSQMDKVKEIQEFIKSNGHEIIEDWTEHLPPKPYDSDIEKSAKYAEIDIESAMQADVFILLTDEAGTGMYVELGAALAQRILNNKPDIYAIGKYLKKPIFIFHPEIKRKDSIIDVLKDLD